MCRPVFREMPLGVYYFFSCSVDHLIQIKVLLAVLQQLEDSQISSVRELMGRVRNVVLIKCILDLGNPRGGWDFEGRVHGPGEEKGS
jgi:hypothetical protein